MDKLLNHDTSPRSILSGYERQCTLGLKIPRGTCHILHSLGLKLRLYLQGRCVGLCGLWEDQHLTGYFPGTVVQKAARNSGWKPLSGDHAQLFHAIPTSIVLGDARESFGLLLPATFRRISLPRHPTSSRSAPNPHQSASRSRD